jgi:hypothetical protein
VALRLINLVSLRSCFQRSFAKRGYSVHLYHRYYDLIRQSVRILSISVFNPYTKGLRHSRIVPAYLTDLPQFTQRLLPCMPPSLPPTGRFVALVCFFTKRFGLRLQRTGSTPVIVSTPFSSRFCEKDTLPHEAAMFALCYGLQSCSPHRNGPLHFREGLGTFTSELSLIRSPS